MNSTTRNALILSLGLILGVSLTVGRSVFADRDNNPGLGPLPLEELRTFTDVFANIKSNYVEPIADKKLLENAIRGMLSGLDPHSTYLDKEAFKELQVGTTGEFGGLGIEVGMEDGFVKVIAPIDDTPAQRAGIAAGDLIIRLDDTPVKGLSLRDAVEIMRGEPGSKIVLTVVREGADAPLKITITRAIIKVKSVKSRLLEDGVGYLRITQFQSHTGDTLLAAIDQLKKENKADLKGVVLDLRNNPGGVLSAAVDVADAFLKKGMIVYTQGRTRGSRVEFKATPDDVLDSAPMVVLINVGSASASEIVSGALQDHHRAIIMGSRSFGKGSVQTVLPMKNGAALKLTTARYYTPSGRSIQAEGITPDIPLERVKVTAIENNDFTPVKEADLSHHLVNGDAKKGQEKELKEKTDKVGSAPDHQLLKEDYQLFEAWNLLKGLQILQQEHAVD